MDLKYIEKHSRFLSFILRHKPEEIGITLDSAGWVSVSELLEAVSKNNQPLTLEQLNFIVENNDKKRFSFSEDGTMIRASQGHSIKVDLGYTSVEPHSPLYHGTTTDSLDDIYENGLQKMKRHHVHLSGDFSTAVKVARRKSNHVIAVLIINTKQMYDDNYTFYISDNGVWLTDHIPSEYISGIKYPTCIKGEL